MLENHFSCLWHQLQNLTLVAMERVLQKHLKSEFHKKSDSQNDTNNNFQFTLLHVSSFLSPAKRKTSNTNQVWVCSKVKG